MVANFPYEAPKVYIDKQSNKTTNVYEQKNYFNFNTYEIMIQYLQEWNIQNTLNYPTLNNMTKKLQEVLQQDPPVLP